MYEAFIRLSGIWAVLILAGFVWLISRFYGDEIRKQEEAERAGRAGLREAWSGESEQPGNG
ncbi:hypothetical protein [Sutterella sp.]|uniref:hypothetical protein n=1 Tax=Sutterella sp. TaxID=1981025 RepID=UPI0026DF6CCF|nr:hypothetical protein [Sutterella sp.]MDO5531827.1 hypothetical protein [Sutterella sp.]